MFAMMSDAVYRSRRSSSGYLTRPKYTCKNSFQSKLDVDTLAEF